MLVRPTHRPADVATTNRRMSGKSIPILLLVLAVMCSVIGPSDVSAAHILLPPVFGTIHGIKTTSFTLALSSPATNPAGTKIYYTLNGSTPKVGASGTTLYANPFAITKTSVVRAVTVSGSNDSYPETQTYIFLANTRTQGQGQVPPAGMGWPNRFAADDQGDAEQPGNSYYPADYEVDPDIVNRYGAATLDNALKSLPSMSIVTDQPNLWDSKYGIYWNASAKEPQDTDPFAPATNSPNGVGVTHKWERPMSIEWIDPNGANAGFSVNGGLRAQGQASRRPHRTPKKSFRVYFKAKDYGDAKVDFNLFDFGNPVSSFDRLILRNGGNRSFPYFDRDQRREADYVQDEWARRTWLQMGNLGSHGTYVHMYINGMYWGLYNVAERVDEKFLQSYLGGLDTDYTTIAADEDQDDLPIADPPDPQDYWGKLLNTVSGTAPITNDQYKTIESIIDVESFADYFVHTHYIGKTDWPHHNWNGYRNINPTAKDPRYKFYPWDSDSGLNKVEQDITLWKDVKGPDDSPSTVFLRLVTNAEFRQLLQDRFYKHVLDPNGALSVENCKAVYTQLAGIIDQAIIGESARWGDYVRDTYPVTNATLLPKTFPAYLHTRDVDSSTAAGENFVDPTHVYTDTEQQSWLNVRDQKLANYCPNRGAKLKGQYQTNGWYPETLKPPVFSQYGGNVAANYTLTIDNVAPNAGRGDVFYTIDGNDPRMEFGTLDPTALNGADLASITVSHVMRVKARVRDGDLWSPMVQAYFYPPQDFANLVISEVHYAPTLTGLPITANPDDYEFIELRNTGTTPIRMDNVYFSKGVSYEFPKNETIWPGQNLILASKKSTFLARYGFEPYDSYQAHLSGLGEPLVLNQPQDVRPAAYMIPGTEIDSVPYLPTAPWPTGANGALPGATGGSLCLPNDSADNSVGSNWVASLPKGTPGAVGCDGAAVAVPGVYFSPTSVDFGEEPTGTPSLPKMVTLANSGSKPLNISSIVPTGDFAQTNACKLILNPTKSCVITVTFTPTDLGPRTGSLAVTSDAPNAPQSMSLAGVGIGGSRTLAVDTTSLAFDTQMIGTTSAPKVVTITNSGTVPVALTTIAATGDFAQTNTCPASLTVGANCAVSVTFTPTATDTRTGTLTISSNATNAPHTISLTGDAIGGVGTFSLSVTSIDFDQVSIGTTSEAQKVRITNSGTGSVNVGVEMDGNAVQSDIDAASDFTQTNDCSATLAAGASCVVSVTFTPTVLGLQSGSLIINGNASNEPQTVVLTGTGVPEASALMYTLFMPTIFR